MWLQRVSGPITVLAERSRWLTAFISQMFIQGERKKEIDDLTNMSRTTNRMQRERSLGMRVHTHLRCSEPHTQETKVDNDRGVHRYSDEQKMTEFGRSSISDDFSNFSLSSLFPMTFEAAAICRMSS